MGWIVGFVCFMVVAVISGCLVAKSPYDKEIEDLEQMKYLSEWSKSHLK